MRLADLPRSEDRATLLRLYDGSPPFDPATATENNIQVNLNDLSGVNLISMARRQWNHNFLTPSNFFTAIPDSGPAHKRMSWGTTVTKRANRLLKRSRAMLGQVRATGGNTMLFGIGPVQWKDRRTVVPTPIPVASLMIPSETRIDEFDETLDVFAVFREWTLAQLIEMTQGPKRDPGWNMGVVQNCYNYIKDDTRKFINSTAFQWMPERIEDLIKQDKGMFGSDAMPTIDVWDTYCRGEDNKGWYRRIILDWDIGTGLATNMPRPSNSRNKDDKGKEGFIYTSGNRVFAKTASEIIHCQFGDCSPYFPQTYHAIRGLGWMLWGVCELQNRLHCKFNESVFEQMMWFFRTASNTDLQRLKKANFEHMGVIPQGITMITAQERYAPPAALVQMAFARNRQLMSDSATSYTQNYEEGPGSKERTATETMALVNSSQSLSSSIMELASSYEEFKYREIFRRLCLKNSKDAMARQFQKDCLSDGVPEDMLDSDKWQISSERPVGGGNKTVQMAAIGFLNNIRKNLPPDGQRMVDFMSVEAATDQPDLAERIAPIGDKQPISKSTENAQFATDRIMRGLQFVAPADAVFEDYVVVWLHDMGTLVQQIMQRGLPTLEEFNGLNNLGNQIQQFLGIMEKSVSEGKGDQEDKAKLKQYQDAYGQLMNHVKALGQRLAQSMKAQQSKNGQPGADPKDAAKAQAMIIQAQTKAELTKTAHAQRTQQRQTQWEMEQKRKDMQTAADIQREGVKTRHELVADRLKALAE